jgi:hypothetical protein
MRLEKTCKCIQSYTKYPDIDSTQRELNFLKGHEYQVDICPLWYQIYVNGGWDDYMFMNEEEFNKYFKLIE